VFITKEAGQTLLQYAGDVDVRLYMLPAVHNTAWSVMVVSFITLLAVSTILSTFFVLRRQRLQHDGSQHLNQGSARLSKGELKALMISVYNKKANASCDMCAICLEEYVNGEKVRVLPCGHGSFQINIQRLSGFSFIQERSF
jgi:E3 ubiquitin-protein ligase RNF13